MTPCVLLANQVPHDQILVQTVGFLGRRIHCCYSDVNLSSWKQNWP